MAMGKKILNNIKVNGNGRQLRYLNHNLVCPKAERL